MLRFFAVMPLSANQFPLESSIQKHSIHFFIEIFFFSGVIFLFLKSSDLYPNFFSLKSDEKKKFGHIFPRFSKKYLNIKKKKMSS